MYARLNMMSRAGKKRIALSVDSALILLSFFLGLALRLGELPAEYVLRAMPAALVMWVLGVGLALALGIPSIKLSAFDLRATAVVGVFAALLGAAGTGLNMALSLGAPRTVPAIVAVLLFTQMVCWRGTGRWMLARLALRHRERLPVAVYGAGAAGVQLISALVQSDRFHLVAVVDDSPGLRGVFISGLRVQAPAVLEELARTGRIARIVLAMPSVPRSRLREIVAELEALPCEVHATPGYPELVSSGDLLGSVRSVSSDDLLGRNAVDLDVPDVAKAYAGRSVLVSGAGGSIGAELCRQVLSCRPRKLVLFELGEFALYSIDREIRPLAEEAGVEVASVLGSVCDRTRVRSVMERHGVEVVLHAAAYKHVPLVEENEVEGVRNNVFGTRVIADAARDLKVERFILISTDKAVRPANVMGGTKRLAEMVVQDLQTRTPGTRFAMVRFGNVLGSSGSVIPLFMSQIAAGGPVTLTHPEITRYFMTVSEAARLVLLAGSYATGGDVFVLDMGEPTRIIDLARSMVRLSGLTVKDADNSDGDIEIRITGLRKGEKLYEELLIGGDALPTPHPKILRAEEFCPSQIEVASIMQELRAAVEANSAEAVRRQIARWVEGFGGAPTAARAASTATAEPAGMAALPPA